jgi:hypothetical protein
MNSNGTFALQYVVPVSSLTPDGHYPKLLQRRQEPTSSDRRLPAISTNFEQTLTFVENFKRHQNNTVPEKTRLSLLLPRESDNDKKPLTPQQLCYQLNLKLENLIRTRVIEQHRVMNRSSILPTKPLKSKTLPKEPLSRTTPSIVSRSTTKNTAISSMTTIVTSVTRDDLADKDSLGDNDEAFEEMVEEENIALLQQQQA